MDFSTAPAADAPELDVTGIDIGTINLALCRMRICSGRPVVVWWQVVDLLGLDGGIARVACANLHRCLQPFLPYFSDCPLFAIEQQPRDNGTMKNVAHGLVAYLHTVSTAAGGCQTFMSAAQNKLKPFGSAETETYEERKASAVRIIGERLQELVAEGCEPARHAAYAEWYAGLAKKDDAADAWLHAYYALERQQVKPYQSDKPKTLSQLSNVQLQEELRRRGLTVSGTKAQLRQRLKLARSGEAGRTRLTLTQLRAALDELGLSADGSKADLAKRLYEAKRPKARTKKAK